MVEIKRLPWSDSGGFSCVHYLEAYKQIKGEWALLQILTNLSRSFTGLKRKSNNMHMWWFKFILGLKVFELVSILFVIVPD